VEDYMVDMHEEGFATSTLWSVYSMIDSYFLNELEINILFKFLIYEFIFVALY